MFEIELIICIKIDLALNKLTWLLCHKAEPNQKEKDCLLATKPFYFIFNFTLLHIGQNRLDITWHCTGAPVVCETCSRSCVLLLNDHLLHSARLPNYLISAVSMQRYSQHWSSHRTLCRNRSLFILLHVSLLFVFISRYWEMVLFKRFAHFLW